MLKAKSAPKQFRHQTKQLSCKFSLLLWNIHKENQTALFAQTFDLLMQQYPADILLFQELKYPKEKHFFFEEYSYSLGANIETKKDIYGVLTAAKSAFTKLESTLSVKKEIGFATHKSLLITKHRLCNAQTLHIINLHAINFVTLKSFAHELTRLKHKVLQIAGPLIIAGDFNNWNKKRLKLLEDFQRELSLEKLQINEAHHIKHIFSHKIDRIYYRGLKALSAIAIDTKQVSDHNPIYADFELVL